MHWNDPRVEPATEDALPEEPRTASLKSGDHPAATAPEIGTVIGGKYLLESLIGRGGMGIVYAATHTVLKERVALKFVSARSSASMTRLLREARLAAAIKSDHVARVLDVGTTDGGMPYVVMEHLEGESLAQRLRACGKLPVADVLAIAKEICAGLAAAHAKGIVHRDLKPSNVFVAKRADGMRVVKLVDFGVAKELAPEGECDGALTNSTTVLGSPFYMAPEQVRSAKDVDARADVWSLGATLYEMLAGKPPFVAETTPGVLAAVVADRPRPLRDVPHGIEQVILRCLAKEREARWPDVGAVAHALDQAASGKRIIRVVAAFAIVACVGVIAVVLARPGSAPVVTQAVPEPERSVAPVATVVAPPVVSAPAASVSVEVTRAPERAARPNVARRAPSASASSPPPPAPPAASVAPRPDVSAATADRH